MHLCFVDESGTPAKPGRPQGYFVVAGLVVPEERWHDIRCKFVGLKRRKQYRGEVKWRFFAPSNGDADNPMQDWSQDDKDDFRREIFTIITAQKSVKIIAGVCDASVAYRLANVNAQDDIYFLTYKVVTERFQYLLQDLSKESGRFTSGVVIADHRNKGEDKRMREQHERLVRESSQYTSTYGNFIESIFLSPSHMSIGIQLADMAAGAIWRNFSHGDGRWLDMVKPAFRTGPNSKIDGFGIARFPKNGWAGPVVER